MASKEPERITNPGMTGMAGLDGQIGRRTWQLWGDPLQDLSQQWDGRLVARKLSVFFESLWSIWSWRSFSRALTSKSEACLAQTWDLPVGARRLRRPHSHRIEGARLKFGAEPVTFWYPRSELNACPLPWEIHGNTQHFRWNIHHFPIETSTIRGTKVQPPTPLRPWPSLWHHLPRSRDHDDWVEVVLGEGKTSTRRNEQTQNDVWMMVKLWFRDGSMMVESWLKWFKGSYMRLWCALIGNQ